MITQVAGHRGSSVMEEKQDDLDSDQALDTTQDQRRDQGDNGKGEQDCFLRTKELKSLLDVNSSSEARCLLSI